VYCRYVHIKKKVPRKSATGALRPKERWPRSENIRFCHLRKDYFRRPAWGSGTAASEVNCTGFEPPTSHTQIFALPRRLERPDAKAIVTAAARSFAGENAAAGRSAGAGADHGIQIRAFPVLDARFDASAIV
jgi:hypothetical protein